MNVKLSPSIGAIILFAATVSSAMCQVVAQSPRSETTTTWQDLGFSQVPDGFPTDKIPLFEGLNESRGAWTFKGETIEEGDSTTMEGNLLIVGNPKAGMFPFWKMTWSWPAENPEFAIVYNIIASPRKNGFDFMLARMGPAKDAKEGKAQPKAKPTMFRGTWNLENRTITWSEVDLSSRGGQPAEEDSSSPKQSFEMVIAADGKVSVQKSKHSSAGQMASGKAMVRTEEAPKEPDTLIGKHSFKAVTEISDGRILPTLPPQATEISLLSERGGHFARYKVKEADFMKFLDDLWETKKNESAHQRDQMGGEGEPANQESMARRFKALGWEPLPNAVTYYSPSKRNGAITTYYYDRETGVAYHDTGYW